jgi:hypothetical protein
MGHASSKAIFSSLKKDKRPSRLAHDAPAERDWTDWGNKFPFVAVMPALVAGIHATTMRLAQLEAESFLFLS